MVRAIVDSVIRLAEADLPPRSLATLHRALSFPTTAFDRREKTGRERAARVRRTELAKRGRNPEFVMRQRMGRWTGATPEEICLISREEGRDGQGRLVFPRGAVGTLRAAVASAGAELAFDDRRVRTRPSSCRCPSPCATIRRRPSSPWSDTPRARRSSPAGRARPSSGRVPSLAAVSPRWCSFTPTTCSSSGATRSAPPSRWSPA